MAKPEHTAYMVMADFTHLNTDEYIVTHTSPVGLDPSCLAQGSLKRARVFGKSNDVLHFNTPEDAWISFGFENADKLLQECRKAAKTQFKKGARPTFFLRKMTMSEFMAHKEFKKYKAHNEIVRKVFKKYLLLDLLK